MLNMPANDATCVVSTGQAGHIAQLLQLTTTPAAAVSSNVNFLATATAAIAFIGCTGSGIPNATPVSTLAAPVKRSVAGNEIDLVMTRAVMSGRSVPRSPRDPESSASGADAKVSTLCLWTLRSRGKGFPIDTMMLAEERG
jgi:hypothetical protein